jgi:hypothetical protein
MFNDVENISSYCKSRNSKKERWRTFFWKEIHGMMNSSHVYTIFNAKRACCPRANFARRSHLGLVGGRLVA